MSMAFIRPTTWWLPQSSQHRFSFVQRLSDCREDIGISTLRLQATTTILVSRCAVTSLTSDHVKRTIIVGCGIYSIDDAHGDTVINDSWSICECLMLMRGSYVIARSKLLVLVWDLGFNKGGRAPKFSSSISTMAVRSTKYGWSRKEHSVGILDGQAC